MKVRTDGNKYIPKLKNKRGDGYLKWRKGKVMGG